MLAAIDPNNFQIIFIIPLNTLKYLIICFSILISSCNNRNRTAASNLFSENSSLVLSVYEDSFRNIFLNRTLISLKALEEKFIRLKDKGGMVFYSCKGATEEPPEDSKVIDLVKKYRLPIKMYTDSTFKTSFF
jgi:hypothetical protein